LFLNKYPINIFLFLFVKFHENNFFSFYLFIWFFSALLMAEDELPNTPLQHFNFRVSLAHDTILPPSADVFVHIRSAAFRTSAHLGEAAVQATSDAADFSCVTSRVVWRMSQLLARWLASRAAFLLRHMLPATRQQLRILELGCGPGLAGLACAKVFGAVVRHQISSGHDASLELPLVVMTDGDPMALGLLRHNLDLNWGGAHRQHAHNDSFH